MQLFISDKDFLKVYGIKSLTEIHMDIKMFAKDVRAPNCFVCNPHANQKSKEVHEFSIASVLLYRSLRRGLNILIVLSYILDSSKSQL